LIARSTAANRWAGEFTPVETAPLRQAPPAVLRDRLPDGPGA
jgi:hypothetical protein